MIFRYLMYFDAQFSCLIQFISLEYTGPCIYMITKTEFIYKDVLQVIKFINQHFNFFLLPFIIPKSSSINIFNIIGHFMFMFLHIIVNSSSNIAVYIYLLKLVLWDSAHNYNPLSPSPPQKKELFLKFHYITIKHSFHQLYNQVRIKNAILVFKK